MLIAGVIVRTEREMRSLARVIVAWMAIAATSGAVTFEELAAQATAARVAGNTSRAIDLYREALRLSPAWAEGWSFLSLCEFETGQYAPALEDIRQGLKTGGVDADTEHSMRFREALLLTRLGLFDQALPRYASLVRRGVPDRELIAGLGVTALRLPLLPKEVPAARQDLIAAAGKAVYFWISGDAGKTDPAFRALLEKHPRAPGVHYLYATYLLSFRPPEEAVAEAKRELEVNPRNADARATIALLLLRGGESPTVLPTALPYARLAAQDGPACPIAQYAYGLILARSGDLRQAIERLETAVRLDPVNLEYHTSLVSAYSSAGRNEDARRERRTTIRLARESGSRGPD
jgi:protein O-GlcNAc transferase